MAFAWESPTATGIGRGIYYLPSTKEKKPRNILYDDIFLPQTCENARWWYVDMRFLSTSNSCCDKIPTFLGDGYDSIECS